MTTQSRHRTLAQMIGRAPGLNSVALDDICELITLLDAYVSDTIDAKKREEFGEPMLRVLVDLCTGEDTMPHDTFYSILDSMNDAEAEYYTECSDAIYFPRMNS